MVEWRLEQENKSTEMVQYIEKGKIKTETGMWKWERSARRLKQNNKDRNVVRDLRGHLEVSEGNDIVLEVSGVCQSLGDCSVVSESWRMVRTELGKQ